MNFNVFLTYMITNILTLVQAVTSCDTVNSCFQTYQPFLFRAGLRTGAGNSLTNGVWGGEICLENNGRSAELSKYGFDSYDVELSTLGGVKVAYLSYDSAAMTLLSISKSPGKSPSTVRYSLALSRLCEVGQKQFLKVVPDFALVNQDQPYFLDEECGYRCGMGPVAMVSRRIFFVMTSVEGNIISQLERVIELREMTECEPEVVLDASATYKPVHCSRRVHEIFREPYRKPNPRTTRWVAKDMKAVFIKNNLHFFLQLFTDSETGPALELLQLTEYQTPQILHSQSIDSYYVAGNSDIAFIGSVAVKENYLCWSTTTKILCSHFEVAANGSFIATKFRPGVVIDESLSRSVCFIDAANIAPQLQTLITGVAVADVYDSLSIYFGCYLRSEIGGLGLGLIKIRHHGLTKEVYSVRDGSVRAYGGGLFVSDSVGVGCPVNGGYEPASSGNNSSVNSGGQKTTAAIGSGSVLQFCSILLLVCNYCHKYCI